ncbi:MAG: hypothetical protein ACUZ8O_09295 [Candidatus Anammoxibacter sp.]
METIFTVKNKDIARLSPLEAVNFFRELLWAEATTLGIGKNLINVPSAITVADGGIDAEIQNVQMNGGQGIIKKGLTRYQIKTGEFSISKDVFIKKILFKDKSTEIKPRIESCFDKGGTLVVVLFGWDNPEIADNQLINKFKAILINIDQKYNNAKIEIWRQNNIIGFLKVFPSLSLKVNGRDQSEFQSHGSWSKNGDMDKPLVKSPDYDKKVESIRDILRSADQACHIRVIGEAGVGKTRFVLEATNEKDITPLVIYTKTDALKNGNLLNDICRDDNLYHVVVIIDECNETERIELWNLLKHRGKRIKLITIYNETETREYGIDYPDLPRLSIDEIKKIILNYRIPQDQVDRWAELAGNSPRFAHMIGINLKHYPDDILRPVEGIYNRIIAGYEDPNSAEVNRRRRVLRHIALFKRFGYKGHFKKEAIEIAKIIEKADSEISLVKFQEIVEVFRKQKILQGEYTLYITPKALHIRMLIEWFEHYGSLLNPKDFFNDLPENSQLREWFFEMFVYAKETEAALDIVKELLGENGPYKNEN